MKEVVTTDGKVYGIPYCTDTRGLWYNREILTKAGVIAEGEDWAPKTWDTSWMHVQRSKINARMSYLSGVTPV